jgi:cytochrome c peroxidase
MNAIERRHCPWDTQKVHKGGFYHDGRFKTLADVVGHYNRHFKLNLGEQERRELIEYLKSL